MQLKKNTKLGKIKNCFFLLFLFFLIQFPFNSNSNSNLEGENVDLKVLDKEIVLNSIMLKWNLVENEFKDLTKNLTFD